MFNIVQRRGLYYLISLSIIIPGIVAMIYLWGTTGVPVRLSIDFRGGSLYTVKFNGPTDEVAIRRVYTQFGQTDPVIQRLGNPEDNTWEIRAGTLTLDQQSALKAELNKLAPVDDKQSLFDVVDPAIGQEVTTAAIFATIAAGTIILLFIWWAFRKVPNAARYGTCAIVAMFHDVFVTLGVMAIMGVFFKWEVDALFLTAMLTVVGFSVQDTIVVFDRIRENSPRYRNEPFETVVNRSMMETLHRSLAIALNAAFVLLAILLFGGATVKQFITILLIGLTSGTYSSIFNAVPLLVSWERGEIPFINQQAKVRAA